MKYVLLPRADADLEEIWRYIATDNPSAADRTIKKLGSLFEKLSQFPFIGRERPEVKSKLRSFGMDSYVVFYRIHKDLIEIIRIMHGSRDIRRVFDA